MEESASRAAQNSPKAEMTRVERMERWFRNQPVFSILILSGLIVIGVSEAAQRGNDLLVLLHLKQEKALELAADSAKGDLSRKLTELAYRRLFWTENYLARVKAHRPASELDYSWDKHLDADAEWSSEYMVNLNGMRQYYPNSEKADQFESIHQEFRKLEYEHVVPLRNAERDGKDHSAEADAASQVADGLNVEIYFFVLNKKPGDR